MIGEPNPRIEAGKVRLRDVLKPRKNVIDYLHDLAIAGSYPPR